MKTIEDFKKAGLVISEYDIIDGVTGDKESSSMIVGDVAFLGFEPCGAWTIREFAWREATLEKPSFKGMIEAKMITGDPVTLNIENLTASDWSLVNSWRPLLNQSIPTETPEEKEELDRIFGKASGEGGKPNEAPVYTQEMYDNGDLPDVGMVFTTEAGGEYTVEYENKKSVCFTDEYGFLVAITIGYIKPIDIRTDKEKAINDLSKLVGDCESDYGILKAIIAGKITGVKWVGK